MRRTPVRPVAAPVVAGFATDRCRRLIQTLAGSFYEVEIVGDADVLTRRAEDGEFAVAIVHIARNRPDHRTLIPRLAHACGVLVLTGDSGTAGEAARIHALTRGADIALPEDVSAAELLWQVHALGRRPRACAPTVVVGPLKFRSGRGTVRLHGEAVELTPTEFRLLQALARDPDAVHLREELHAAVWSWPDADDAGSRTLDVHASRLRQKLGRDGDRFVIAARGSGYRLR